MNTPINKDNVGSFAYTNKQLINGKPRGIVVEFHGLGGGRDLIREDWPLSKFLAGHNVLYVIPYYGPWAWMSDKSVRYTDEVIDALFELLGLDPDTPIVSSGYSMGGQGALVYCRYARRTPSACAVISPVCDLPYHYTERPDLPRTIYLALSHYDCELNAAMESASPLHLAPEMPDIPYALFCGQADDQVSPARHAEPFIKAMENRGASVEYTAMPELGHCALTGEAERQYYDFVCRAALGEIKK